MIKTQREILSEMVDKAISQMLWIEGVGWSIMYKTESSVQKSQGGF